jgi:hypothetical protein
MRDDLKDAFPNLRLRFDKAVDGGCSGRRPDVFLDCLTHVVIVECDENRHTGYSCENKRMMQLFEDCGRRPIVFIRFNPDSYINNSGKRVPGCFVKNEKGLRQLVEMMNVVVAEMPAQEVTIKHLFF